MSALLGLQLGEEVVAGLRAVSWSVRQAGAVGWRGCVPHCPHGGQCALHVFAEHQVPSQGLSGTIQFSLHEGSSSSPFHRRSSGSLREELRFTWLSQTLELDLGHKPCKMETSVSFADLHFLLRGHSVAGNGAG